MSVRRYVLTGAPGSGKTVLAEALRARGHAVVAEAATDVIAELSAQGSDEPWREPAAFVDKILAVQIARQRAATAAVQVFDRSPLCTLALARWSGIAPTAAITAEIARLRAERLYQPEVFLVQPLGFVTPTAARRISYADSLRFAAVHEDVYREYGFTLVDVPPVPVGERVTLVERYLA
jgi:predicted ATPase